MEQNKNFGLNNTCKKFEFDVKKIEVIDQDVSMNLKQISAISSSEIINSRQLVNHDTTEMSKYENSKLQLKIAKIEDMPDSDSSYWESEYAMYEDEEDDFDLESYQPSIKSS